MVQYLGFRFYFLAADWWYKDTNTLSCYFAIFCDVSLILTRCNMRVASPAPIAALDYLGIFFRPIR